VITHPNLSERPRNQRKVRVHSMIPFFKSVRINDVFVNSMLNHSPMLLILLCDCRVSQVLVGVHDQKWEIGFVPIWVIWEPFVFSPLRLCEICDSVETRFHNQHSFKTRHFFGRVENVVGAHRVPPKTKLLHINSRNDLIQTAQFIGFRLELKQLLSKAFEFPSADFADVHPLLAVLNRWCSAFY